MVREPDDFEELVAKLGLDAHDVLVVADGSGTTLDGGPCGWHVEAFATKSRRTFAWRGAATTGTNNYAELMPFIHALWHLNSLACASGRPRPRIRVELVSDSELTVRCGNGQYSRNANLPLWAAIDWYAQNGYDLHWNWVPRNSNPINTSADAGARRARQALEGVTK